jgi:Zn-dependent protease with chaperone function
MAYGLYTHIQSNRRRSIALLIGLFLLVYVMTFAGALLAEALMVGNASIEWLLRAAWRDLIQALPFVTIGTLIWMWIAYKFHQKMIDALTGGHEITRQDNPRVYNLLENMCISRGITMPKLKIMESDALNAFATGLNEKQYSITVTSRLVDQLDDAELEAVLGHELTHIRNGDVRMLVIAVIMAGVISFFAEMVFRIADLFATHPSIDRRVEAIIRFAGGRDPGPIALPEPQAPAEEGHGGEESSQWSPTGPGVPPTGPPTPFGAGGDKPFLPSQPPVEIGGRPAQDGGPPDPQGGPWGPPRRN